MKDYKQMLILLCFLSSIVVLHAQKYASPNVINSGTGSINDPYDLQTGLDNILPGETLWLRGGLYNGRFNTNNSNDGTAALPITVASYPGEWAVLNGNLGNSGNAANNGGTQTQVLRVTKSFYTFRDFEITAGISKDKVIRHIDLPNFYIIGGINNTDVNTNCRFINLIIHDVIGGAIASWRATGGSEFYGCLIYNNGYQNTIRGAGHAFYIQNETEDTRIIQNNIVFNNFYKGISVWSGGSLNDITSTRVQNVNIINNTSFNQGSYQGKDNILIGSENFGPRNIKIEDNQLYHNTTSGDGGGAGISLNIGNNTSNPFGHPDEISINNNLIIGRTHSVAFNAPEKIEFKNNLVYSRYVLIEGNTTTISNDWGFSNNVYYTKKNQWSNTAAGFRTYIDNQGMADITLQQWQTLYNLDLNSSWDLKTSVPASGLLHKSITQNEHKHNRFKVVIADFKKPIENVSFLSFSNQLNINTAPYYEVRDVEDYNAVIETGNIVDENYTLTLNIGLTTLAPLLGDIGSGSPPFKTFDSFGVFEVNFSECEYDIFLEGIETSNTTHQAATSITCAGDPPDYIINSSADVTLIAGQFISLLPGFHAELGSEFIAEIEHCETNVDYNGIEIEYLHQPLTRIANANEIKSDDSKEDIVKVYPNPTSKNITIESTKTMTHYELLNQLGTTHKSENVNHKTPTLVELNIDDLPTGMYFLKITLNTGEIITKQVIKN